MLDSLAFYLRPADWKYASFSEPLDNPAHSFQGVRLVRFNNNPNALD
jgi:hypothetical protein